MSENFESGRDGFVDYIESTIDPGHSVLIATITFGILSQLLIPCMVILENRYRERSRNKRRETYSTHEKRLGANSKSGLDRDTLCSTDESSNMSQSTSSSTGPNQRANNSHNEPFAQKQRVSSGSSEQYEGWDNEGWDDRHLEETIERGDNELKFDSRQRRKKLNIKDPSDVTLRENKTVVDLERSERHWWMCMCMDLNYVVSLAKGDKETKRILRLSLPFTTMALVEAVLENVKLIVVGHYLGTDALVALAVADVLLGFSADFLMGIIDSHATLCSHALGAGNNHLAGQYIQLVVGLYTLCYIPFIVIWYFLVYDAMIWWDFTDEVAEMGQAYARVAVFGLVLEGWGEAYHGLLEVMGHENYVMFAGIGESVVDAILISLNIIYVPNAQLTTIAWIEIEIGVIFLIFNICFTIRKGWMRPYAKAMFGSIAAKNHMALTTVVSTAIPLAFGTLLSSGEWEVLTIFAGHMGPAEVATLAILGNIWDTFEAVTEGMGDAAEIRCAYHLGKGDPKMARISSHKSIFFGMAFALIVTSIFFLIGDRIGGWFTNDRTLQRLILELVPLVGIGNITMAAGMICWAVVGSQGRYQLATFVAAASSLLVTIPLGAFFTYGLNLNLQSLVAALVIGDSTVATILSYVLIRSKWEDLSDQVREANAITGEIDSSDSEDDDDDSSSSSSDSSTSSSSDSSSSTNSESNALDRSNLPGTVGLGLLAVNK